MDRKDSWPDITIIFTKDAAEWDEYLTECFTQMIDSPSGGQSSSASAQQPLIVAHERLENMRFPLTALESQQFANSRAVLLIISPDLLDHVDAHADVYELTRLLPPKRTVCMLCGVQETDVSSFHRAALVTFDQWQCLVARDQDKEFVETDVSSFHRAALVTFDQWQCLVARDQDKEFVVSVIQAVQHVVQQAAEQSAAKPQFKLTPRKVKEANGKVFILLDSPVSDKQQIDILVDGCGDNQVSVKWKNAYTLYFILPENMLRVAKVMNISLICDTKHFMGTRPLKCETQMSELHGLLSSVNSPF
ncbi:unnamed protein product, partial [Medioppia subpectinata]